jgi:hypothetical protein
MSFLSFLNDVTISEVTKPTRTGGGVKKQWNPEPTFMGIRIWKDGSIFPSQTLVDTFGLEYPKAIVTIEEKTGEDNKIIKKRSYEYPEGTGYGMDIVDSRSWSQCNSPKAFIAVALVTKDQPKVDLFASTKYNEDGTPFSSVMDQGSATYGENELLPTIKEVYNIEPNEEGFIDLLMDQSVNLKALSSNGILLFPKKVNRGADKGKADYQRRDNVDVFALVPVQLLDVKEEGVQQADEEADVQPEA